MQPSPLLEAPPLVYRFRPRLDARRRRAIVAVSVGGLLLAGTVWAMASLGIYRAGGAAVVTLALALLVGAAVFALLGWLEPLREPAEYRAAIRALSRGDRTAATEAVERAIAAAPHSFSPWTLKGLLLSQAGDFEGSLRAYREATERRPESWIGWSGAGAALLNLGRLAEAVEALGKALALGASWPVPRYQLGLALFLRGEWAGAAEAFGEALFLGLDAPNLQLVARSLRAYALERTGSIGAARDERERATGLKGLEEIHLFAERLKGATLSPVGRLAAWAVGIDPSPEPPGL